MIYNLCLRHWCWCVHNEIKKRKTEKIKHDWIKETSWVWRMLIYVRSISIRSSITLKSNRYMKRYKKLSTKSNENFTAILFLRKYMYLWTYLPSILDQIVPRCAFNLFARRDMEFRILTASSSRRYFHKEYRRNRCSLLTKFLNATFKCWVPALQFCKNLKWCALHYRVFY